MIDLLGMDPEALRAARWVARGLTLLAAWPLGYAFYGKSQFDAEAMMFGGPGVVIGLALWLWSGYRLRHPIEGPAPAPASTIGGRLTQKLDAQLAKLSDRVPATIGLGVASLACVLATGLTILATERGHGEMAVVCAVLVGLVAIGWRAIEQRGLAIATTLLAGGALLAKPWVAPVSDVFMGERHVFSPTSETHLYFVLPGLALLGIAVILVLGTKVQAPVQANLLPPEPTRLVPPKPNFPRPPGSP